MEKDITVDMTPVKTTYISMTQAAEMAKCISDPLYLFNKYIKPRTTSPVSEEEYIDAINRAQTNLIIAQLKDQEYERRNDNGGF